MSSSASSDTRVIATFNQFILIAILLICLIQFFFDLMMRCVTNCLCWSSSRQTYPDDEEGGRDEEGSTDSIIKKFNLYGQTSFSAGHIFFSFTHFITSLFCLYSVAAALSSYLEPEVGSSEWMSENSTFAVLPSSIFFGLLASSTCFLSRVFCNWLACCGNCCAFLYSGRRISHLRFQLRCIFLDLFLLSLWLCIQIESSTSCCSLGNLTSTRNFKLIASILSFFSVSSCFLCSCPIPCIRTKTHYNVLAAIFRLAISWRFGLFLLFLIYEFQHTAFPHTKLIATVSYESGFYKEDDIVLIMAFIWGIPVLWEIGLVFSRFKLRPHAFSPVRSGELEEMEDIL